MNYKLLIVILIAILGLYVVSTKNSHNIIETFKSNDNSCPNILIQKGNKIFLKNTRYAEIPGVNPIVFNNLNVTCQAQPDDLSSVGAFIVC